MSTPSEVTRVAVIGAGCAGAACAQGLAQSGFQVTLFEKSRGVGGRMATRRLPAAAEDLQAEPEFDHGAQHFSARRPRFRAVVARAVAAGVLQRWSPRIHAAWPAPLAQESLVPVPRMTAFCRHLIGDLAVHLSHTVQRLHRVLGGWQVVVEGGETAGLFDQVMLALPPAQAAVLLAGHHDDWADTLVQWPMQPCWTLMARTPEVDWPWDAARPSRGPLAWVARQDRKPGRSAVPGQAQWVAQATAEWSQAHLDADAAAVRAALVEALAAQLPPGTPVEALSVHRWRYALAGEALAVQPSTADGEGCWWDDTLGLGVCGDFLGARLGQARPGDAGAGVEAAWLSGDELADTVAAAQERRLDAAAEALACA